MEYADISGMSEIRMVINTLVIIGLWAILWCFTSFRENMRNKKENETRVGMIAGTIVVFFYWVILPIEGNFDTQAFDFFTTGSWSGDFLHYYITDWVWRSTWSIVMVAGGSAFVILGAIWPARFAPNAVGAEQIPAWLVIIMVGWIVGLGILSIPFLIVWA